MYVYIYVCIYMCACVYIISMHIYIYIYTKIEHASTHLSAASKAAWSSFVHKNKYTYMCVCIHTYVHT